jgi:hypothetical protein
MQSLARRWRQRADDTRSRRAIARAIEAANTPTLAAELRAIAQTQNNR